MKRKRQVLMAEDNILTGEDWIRMIGDENAVKPRRSTYTPRKKRRKVSAWTMLDR